MKVIFERIIKPGNQPQIQFKMDGWIYIFGGSFQKSMLERLWIWLNKQVANVRKRERESAREKLQEKKNKRKEEKIIKFVGEFISKNVPR